MIRNKIVSLTIHKKENLKNLFLLSSSYHIKNELSLFFLGDPKKILTENFREDSGEEICKGLQGISTNFSTFM